MKYLRELIIAVLVIGFVYYLWTDAEKDAKREEDLKKALLSRDSAIHKAFIADTTALGALTRANLSEKAQKAALERARNSDKIINEIRHRPVPRLSSHQIDSAADTVIARLRKIR